MNIEDVDILYLLRMDANVFYEYKADDGRMLKRAAQEIEDLRSFRNKAFRVNPNIDLDMEALAKRER